MGVTGAQLQKVIDLYPGPEQPKVNRTYTRNNKRLDVPSYLAQYGIERVGEKQHGNSKLYLLKECLFDPSHTDKESAIGQTEDGKLFYHCFHDSCKDQKWEDARKYISGDNPLFSNNKKESVASVASSATVDFVKCNAGFVANPLHPKLSIPDLVKDYVFSHSGDFTTTALYQELSLMSREEKNAAGACLRRLAAAGKIEKNDVIRGRYSVVAQEKKIMKLNPSQPEPFPLPLPLNLYNNVGVFPGDIVVWAGETNTGKTTGALGMVRAFLTEILPKATDLQRTVVKFNLRGTSYPFREYPLPADFSKVQYMDSEMGELELARQLHRFGEDGYRVFDDAVNDGRLEFVDRSHDWARIIEPDGLNVVDYMQIYDSFYEIGQKIADIRERLQSGVAIVLIQKKQGAPYPRGGEFALEKARLAMLLSGNERYGNILTLRKVKHPVGNAQNPQGMEIDYRITQSGEVQALSELRFVNKKQRQTINAQYQRELDSPDKTDHWEKF